MGRLRRLAHDGAIEVAPAETELVSALCRAFAAYENRVRSQRIKAGLRRTKEMKKRA